MKHRLVSLAWIVMFASTAPSQDTPGAKALGLTRDSGTLPIWSKPSEEARGSLGSVARTRQRSLFLVGTPKDGHGTAWVVSKKHRLLVTNGHVADIRAAAKNGKMFAIPNGGSDLYTVEKVWYHPAIRRCLKGNANLSVRSVDPNDGEVDPTSPDIAVLQLSANGPDLTDELGVATEEEIKSLFAQPAAIMGFPGHDTSWPALGDTAAASFHDGVVSRVTDFQLGASCPENERQFLQYTMSTWGGFSGSPIFLVSGRVAAVHNMARTVRSSSGEVRSFAHGIRIDCLLELIVQHKLEGMVPFPIDKSKLALDRLTKPDARGDKAREDFAKARTLVREAERDVHDRQEYKAAIEKCDAALELAPNYGRAYSTRASAIGFICENSENLSERARIELMELAIRDTRKVLTISPNDPYEYIHICQYLTYLGRKTKDENQHRKVLVTMSEFLADEKLTRFYRGYALVTRGRAYYALGESDAALRDYDKGLALVPDEPSFLKARATLLENVRLRDHGKADRAESVEVVGKGLRVEEITEGSAAQRAKIRKGDIIFRLNGYIVHSFEGLQAVLTECDGPVMISVVRGNEEFSSPIEIKGKKLGVSVVRVPLPK